MQCQGKNGPIEVPQYAVGKYLLMPTGAAFTV
jgi:hypothetical protein